MCILFFYRLIKKGYPRDKGYLRDEHLWVTHPTSNFLNKYKHASCKKLN